MHLTYGFINESAKILFVQESSANVHCGFFSACSRWITRHFEVCPFVRNGLPGPSVFNSTFSFFIVRNGCNIDFGIVGPLNSMSIHTKINKTNYYLQFIQVPFGPFCYDLWRQGLVCCIYLTRNCREGYQRCSQYSSLTLLSPLPWRHCTRLMGRARHRSLPYLLIPISPRISLSHCTTFINLHSSIALTCTAQDGGKVPATETFNSLLRLANSRARVASPSPKTLPLFHPMCYRWKSKYQRPVWEFFRTNIPDCYLQRCIWRIWLYQERKSNKESSWWA